MNSVPSIFTISQDGDKDPNAVTPGQTDEDLKKAKEQVEQEDSTPQEQVMKALSTEESKTEPTIPEEGKKENKPELVIKVEGPVGRVFTDALNKVLAIEKLTSEILEYEDSYNEIAIEYSGEDNPLPIEVHTVDGDYVQMSDVVKLNDVINMSEGVEHVIAIENASNVSPSLVMLNKMGEFKNVKVCLSIDNAARHVFNRSKG